MTTSSPPRRRTGPFIATKEHRRFVEFADAVRRESYIGLCFGPAGVGKTLSARRYTHWDTAEPLLEQWGPRQDSDAAVYASLARSRAVFYTPTTSSTPRQLDQDLAVLFKRVEACIDQHVRRDQTRLSGPTPRYVDLLVVDEADRLSAPALEHLRDRFDRRPLGLLLIGMPVIDKRLSRYPQLYSRMGFSHQYRPLRDDRARIRPEPPLASLASPWTSPTSPTPKPSPPSAASPAATSDSSTACSSRSNES